METDNASLNTLRKYKSKLPQCNGRVYDDVSKTYRQCLKPAVVEGMCVIHLGQDEGKKCQNAQNVEKKE